MTHIMDHTMAMREKGGRYVFLIKAATSETWWPEDADHIMFIRGRIGFDLPVWFVPADNKQKPTGAFFAGAIAIFDKSWRGERFSYISRTELEEKGKAFMSLVEFAAGKVQPPATTVPEQEEPIVAPAVLPDVDSRIWPLEVGLVFNQVEGADSLDALQQNKLKANINQLGAPLTRGRWPVVTSLALMAVNTRALPAWRSLSNYDVSRSHRLN